MSGKSWLVIRACSSKEILADEYADLSSSAGWACSMTSLAKLLAQKQRLLERLQEGPGEHERDEIERLLAEINETLALLDESGPGISGDRRE